MLRSTAMLPGSLIENALQEPPRAAAVAIEKHRRNTLGSRAQPKPYQRSLGSRSVCRLFSQFIALSRELPLGISPQKPQI